jgi:hypothetical protein
MPHSQSLSDNSYVEPNQPRVLPISLTSFLLFSSHLRLGLPKDLFPLVVSVKMLNELTPSSNLVA